MAVKTIQELIFGGAFIFGVLLLHFYFLRRAKRGKVPKVRTLAGLKGIEEAISRCAETGETVLLYSSGSLQAIAVDQSIAGMGIASYAARFIARYGVRMIFPYVGDDASALPMYHEVLRSAYVAEGKPEGYDPDSVRLIARTYADSMSAWADLIKSENTGCTMAFGDIRYFNPILCDMQGISIQATAQMNTIHVVALLCNYSFIGDEMYAAGAMASGDKLMLSSLAVQDAGKFIVTGIAVIGAILWVLGIKLV